MLITLGAQIVETVIIRGALFAIQGAGSITYWIGESVYHYYYPKDSEDSEDLKLDTIRKDMTKLKRDIENLKEKKSDD